MARRHRWRPDLELLHRPSGGCRLVAGAGTTARRPGPLSPPSDHRTRPVARCPAHPRGRQGAGRPRPSSALDTGTDITDAGDIAVDNGTVRVRKAPDSSSRRPTPPNIAVKGRRTKQDLGQAVRMCGSVAGVLLPVASAIAPPVIPEAVHGGIRERQPQGLGRGVAWPQDVVGGASVEKSARSGSKSYCVQGGVDM